MTEVEVLRVKLLLLFLLLGGLSFRVNTCSLFSARAFSRSAFHASITEVRNGALLSSGAKTVCVVPGSKTAGGRLAGGGIADTRAICTGATDAGELWPIVVIGERNRMMLSLCVRM